MAILFVSSVNLNEVAFSVCKKYFSDSAGTSKPTNTRPKESNLNERIYRFQFPERPGALGEFLSNLNHQWNITLFHYRNHGAAFGRPPIICRT